MSKLETVVRSLVELFEEHAGQDEHKNQLSGAELQQLLKTELQSPEFKCHFNPEDVDAVMAELDKNHDGDVNFHEFCRFVEKLAHCYRRKCQGKDK
ncbi:S100 calcium binding protein W [Amia ocellicauda]|uniref:S100 calcium binding protein W n=1 Tax=Amia ocellicauda TaxID=2972642 RepID=UPI003464B379|nr:S10A1 protein [Amia calva]